MNSESNLNTGTSRKIWRRLFIGILSLQAVLELVIGLALLFNFPSTVESGFGITYSNELDVLGIALGLYLLLLTTLMIISALWTYRSNISGTILGIIVGLFLFTFGVATFLKFGELQGLIVDSIRGLITIIFGFMARKELKQY
jgi:hypothetical protein